MVVDYGGAFYNREEYRPYGESSFGSFAKKRYRFTGKERDEESSLYYHGARYYAPWAARWTATDPLGMVDGPNLYAYVRGNPICLSDPSGTQVPKKRKFISGPQNVGDVPRVDTGVKIHVDHCQSGKPALSASDRVRVSLAAGKLERKLGMSREMKPILDMTGDTVKIMGFYHREEGSEYKDFITTKGRYAGTWNARTGIEESAIQADDLLLVFAIAKKPAIELAKAGADAGLAGAKNIGERLAQYLADRAAKKAEAKVEQEVVEDVGPKVYQSFDDVPAAKPGTKRMYRGTPKPDVQQVARAFRDGSEIPPGGGADGFLDEAYAHEHAFHGRAGSEYGVSTSTSKSAAKMYGTHTVVYDVPTSVFKKLPKGDPGLEERVFKYFVPDSYRVGVVPH